MATIDLANRGAVPANELRQVTSLLWVSIENGLHPAEVPDVRRVLGSDALEENERLFEEASALAEIIGDVRHAVDTAAHRRLNSKKSLYANPTRGLVEGELRLLIASIKQCSAGGCADGRPDSGNGSSRSSSRPNSHQGTRPAISWSDIGAGTANDPLARLDSADASRDLNEKKTETQSSADAARTQSLLASTDEERALLKYVTAVSDDLAIRQRPHSSSSRPGSSRPGTSSSRPGSSHSSHSSVQFVKNFGEQINAAGVDAMAEPLRGLLKLERDALLEDIEYLQLCLEDEADFLAESGGRNGSGLLDGDNTSLREDENSKAPPDVATLRAYSAKLRTCLDVEKHRVVHTVQLHRLLSVSTEGGVLGKAGRLRSLGDLNKANAQPQGLDDSNEKVSFAPAPPPAPPTAPRPPTGGRAAAFKRRVG